MKNFSLSSLVYLFGDEGFSGNHIEALRKVKRCGFDETELVAEGPVWNGALGPDLESFKQALKAFLAAKSVCALITLECLAHAALASDLSPKYPVTTLNP